MRGRVGFSQLSIRAKFTLASAAIGMLAILCATAGYLYYQSAASREAMVRELETIGRMVGSNAGAAILFNDPESATDILSALRNKPDIAAAEILMPDGMGFAFYQRAPGRDRVPALPLHSSVTFADDGVDLVAPIVTSSEQVGWIHIRASLDSLRAQRSAFLQIAILIALGAGIVALGFSSILQKAILRPIMHLAETMADVSHRKDFSTRAVRTTEDELGTLIDGFNEMLSQIDSQHSELATYRRNLEQLVERRTEELSATNRRLAQTVDELREANARSEAANRAKSEFLANMSHELRTPLNAIIGFSEIIKNKMFGPIGTETYAEYAGDIWTSGSHLLEIINDILDMTKVEVGTFRLNESVSEVGQILATVHTLIRPEAERHRIDFPPPVIDPPGICIRCDTTRIRQILLNLLSNAVKFTNEGGTISLEAKRRVEGIAFRVRDNGIGIDPANFERILSPFGQIESAYARNHQGVGLGLSLTKVLVEQHDGTLEFDSALGRGTTVTVLLPEIRIVVGKAALAESAAES